MKLLNRVKEGHYKRVPPFTGIEIPIQQVRREMLGGVYLLAPFNNIGKVQNAFQELSVFARSLDLPTELCNIRFAFI